MKLLIKKRSDRLKIKISRQDTNCHWEDFRSRFQNFGKILLCAFCRFPAVEIQLLVLARDDLKQYISLKPSERYKQTHAVKLAVINLEITFLIFSGAGGAGMLSRFSMSLAVSVFVVVPRVNRDSSQRDFLKFEKCFVESLSISLACPAAHFLLCAGGWRSHSSLSRSLRLLTLRRLPPFFSFLFFSFLFVSR